MEKKLQQIYVIYYSLLIVQDLWQGHYHKIKCKFEHDDKKRETCGIKYKYCDCFLEYMSFKDDLIECKCLCCNKNYQTSSTKS